MTAKEILFKIKRYTEDSIVYALIKQWLDKDAIGNILCDLFNRQKRYRFKIIKRKNKNGKLETIFKITSGILFRDTFTVRLV